MIEGRVKSDLLQSTSSEYRQQKIMKEWMFGFLQL